jgi:hypothetical protein
MPDQMVNFDNLAASICVRMFISQKPF